MSLDKIATTSVLNSERSVLFRVAVVCDKSPRFGIVKTAIDRVDRIRVMIIGRKTGARFWDHQSVLCLTKHLGDAVKLLKA